MAALGTATQAICGVSVTARFAVTHSFGVAFVAGCLALIATVWVCLRSQAGLFALVRAALRDGPLPSFAEAFANGRDRCLGLALTQLLAAIALAAFMTLPLILGLVTSSPWGMIAGGLVAAAIDAFLAFRWSVLVPVVLQEGVTGTAALGRSSALV